VISLEDISVSLGGVSVLDSVDLTVDRGEFVGLIGPNGAGKTTLLRTINGIIQPDSGTVQVGGEATTDISARALSRQVATVPQDTHVGFAFTAEQIVEMGRTPHRSRLDWSDDSDPVERALERTDTTHLADRQIGELSGGERQRVLLARALAQEPDTLLLDEPTASLDINHQINVLELAAGLVSDGRAALAAIHDLDLAAQFCDRLLLLHDGSVSARGTPETVLRDEQLDTAFETTTAVSQDPVTGAPRVTAIADRPNRDGRIHVVGNGESGVAVLRVLWRAGYDVSVGVVPRGDVLARLADHLGVPSIPVSPFEAPEEAAQKEAGEYERAADVVVTAVGASEGVRAPVEADPEIHAALDTESPAVARGDGGQLTVVESASELLAAVQSHVTR
jgi:iron complex transport system ATP-binding protein